MARTLETLKVMIVADASKFDKTLKQGRDNLGRFTKNAETAGSKLARYTKAAGLAAAKTSALAAVAGTAWGVKLAVQAETARVQFETLTGSAGQAAKVIRDINKFAAETPLGKAELQDAGRMLLAFGTNAGDVTEELRRLGDVGSLTGNRIGDLAEIYGKARVQGRLFAEDINQLTGRGIPIIGEFAKQLGVATSEVKQLASDGKISFKNLEAAFISMTAAGGKFAGGLAKQSETLAGRWSTLTDNLAALALTMGEKLLPAIRDITTALERALSVAQRFGMFREETPTESPVGRGREFRFRGLSEFLMSAAPGGRTGRNEAFFSARERLGGVSGDIFGLRRDREGNRLAQGGKLLDAFAGVPGAIGTGAESTFGPVLSALQQAGSNAMFSLRFGANQLDRAPASPFAADRFGAGLFGGIGRGINAGIGAGASGLAGMMEKLKPGETNDKFGLNTAVLKGSREAQRLDAMDRAAADLDRERNITLDEIAEATGKAAESLGIIAKKGLGALGL